MRAPLNSSRLASDASLELTNEQLEGPVMKGQMINISSPVTVKSAADRLRFGLRIAASILVSVAFFALAPTANSEDTGTNSPASQPKAAAKSAAPQTAAPARHQLSGAELYSIHCNRCHPERYPTERTAAQWKTIMLHMRVRANLPAEQARTILHYLQENSGR